MSGCDGFLFFASLGISRLNIIADFRREVSGLIILSYWSSIDSDNTFSNPSSSTFFLAWNVFDSLRGSLPSIWKSSSLVGSRWFLFTIRYDSFGANTDGSYSSARSSSMMFILSIYACKFSSCFGFATLTPSSVSPIGVSLMLHVLAFRTELVRSAVLSRMTTLQSSAVTTD